MSMGEPDQTYTVTRSGLAENLRIARYEEGFFPIIKRNGSFGVQRIVLTLLCSSTFHSHTDLTAILRHRTLTA